MPTATPTIETQIQDALSDWTLREDGWFYPAEPVDSLVRVNLSGGHYIIQRRRTLTTPWTLLVKAMTADFDPSAFATWQNSWVMSV